MTLACIMKDWFEGHLSTTNSTRFFKVTYISDQLSRLKWPSFFWDQSRVTLKKPSAPKNNGTSRARASFFFLFFSGNCLRLVCYILYDVMFFFPRYTFTKTVFYFTDDFFLKFFFEIYPSLKYDSIMLGCTSLCEQSLHWWSASTDFFKKRFLPE